MRLNKCMCVFGLAMFLVLASGSTSAQVNYANLSGQVLDPQNLPVPGAKVTVTNKATGASQSTQTDSDGRYKFVGLSPGRYELLVDAGKGLTLTNPELTLFIGQEATFEARLQLATVAQKYEVTDQPDLIEVHKTAVSGTVTGKQIDGLPIDGRDYKNFSLLDSRSNRDNAPSIGAAPTSGINFGGQRARSNQVSVDGADAGDNSVNGIRATVSQEAVQEFQVIMSNYNAEYGRASGGVVNIVTKQGGNELHGDLFGFFRHKDLQARNPFSVGVNPTTGALMPTKQAFTRTQGGATFGGPLVKDKTFFFFSYEITRRQETGFTNIGANNFNLTAAPNPASPIPCIANSPGLLTPAQAAFLANPAVPAAVKTPYGGLAIGGSSVALCGTHIPGAFFPTSGAPLPASFVSLFDLRGNFPEKEGTSLWSGRLDHIWNPRNSSFVRVSVAPSLITGIQVNAQNQNFGQNAGSRTSLQQTRDFAVVGQHVTSFSSNLFNEARFQYSRRGLHYGFSQLPGGSSVGVQITGFAFFGREPFSTVDRIERRFQWTDNMTWSVGKHTFKYGADINWIQLRSKKAQIFELNFGGLFNFGLLSASTFGLPDCLGGAGPACTGGIPVPPFNAVQTYGLGIPQSFIQGIGTSSNPFDNKAFGGFIQDSWKILPRLTLNYGVRYDVELTPLFPAGTAVNAAAEKAFNVVEGIPRDYNNFAPRAALAWDLRGNSKTVVRAGYGLFYDHPLLAVAFNSFTAEGAKSVQLISAGGTPGPANLNGSSIFQGVLANASFGPFTFAYLPSQQRFDPKAPNSIFANQNYLTAGVPIAILPFTLPVSSNFVYAYAQQGNLTIEQQLGKDFKFSVSYTYTHGSHLNRPRDINSTDPILLTSNFRNALVANLPAAPSSPAAVQAPTSDRPSSATACGVTVSAPGLVPGVLGVLSGCPGPLAALNGQFLGTAAFFNFFRPSGPNPSFGPLVPGGYATQVAIAKAAGYPAGLGVPVPWGGVDNQESTGSSVYHGLTVNLEKRFNHHFLFLSSYTWSHAIDDSTDLQTLLEPQEERRPDLERGNSTFDQRHRWVSSAIFESPYKRSDDGFWRKFLADFAVAPVVEVSTGRPYSVLSGTDFRLNLGATQGRPSVVSSGGVTSPFIPGVQFTPPTVCNGGIAGGPVSATPPAGCTGNLGRNTFYRPGYFQWDLRISRKFYFTEHGNLEVIADAFNLFNRNNTADVVPLCDLSGFGTPGATCNAGQPSAAHDPRQFQFGLKFNW